MRKTSNYIIVKGAALRGRGEGWKHKLEIRSDNVANSLTRVTKDSIIVLGWTRDKKGNIVNYHPVNISNSITANKRDNTQNYILCDGIRRYTPHECFRLMGVKEADIDTLLASGISNSQLYKLAGNSIVVNCLTAIFRNLFIK